MKSHWIVGTDSFVNEPENIMRNGNVYQLANGYMGYRGTLDEFGPKEKVGITLAGIFDQVGDAWREPVNAPNGGFTLASLGGEDPFRAWQENEEPQRANAHELRAV